MYKFKLRKNKCKLNILRVIWQFSIFKTYNCLDKDILNNCKIIKRVFK